MSANPAQVEQVAADWRTRAAAVKFRTECFIDGRYVEQSEGGETFATVNPATGQTLANFPSGSARDVDRAVRAARAAFRSWGAQPPDLRKKCLLDFAAKVESRAEQFALRDSLEMGKPVKMALAELHVAVRFLRFYAEAIDKTHGEVAPTDPARGLTLTLREPWGVVGAIVPWN
ncbi:MAG: aldehyde dehydrogenase family protein, partial [Steroidobacteraceae bacterium]